MKVTVLRNSCALSGYCERVAPEVFDAAGTGDTIVALRTAVVGEPDLARAVREAADLCPTGAIVLTQAEGAEV